MIRSTFGDNRYVAGEDDAVLGTAQSWAGTRQAGVIYCHGANNNTETVIAEAEKRQVLYGLARYATVHVGDLGGDTFGNDTGITRVGQAIAYLRAEWGQSGPVALVGSSMGAIVALAYTLAHPDEVLAVAGIIPGLDIADLYTRGMGIPEDIDAAYPPAYDDETDGPTHSPVRFAADLPADLPIALWTASNDALAVPATADEFVSLRPQTERTDLGALGHTDAAIGAAAEGVALFIRDLL